MPTPRYVIKPGDVFGRWTVVRFYDTVIHGDRIRNVLWCKCECGTRRAVLQTSLIGCVSVSCGCYQKERAKEFVTKHGDTIDITPEYIAWNNMLARCTNPNNPRYPAYGGRGITVDSEWYDYRNFIKDMGRRPSPKHSIDRKDNDGDYTKDNCRWVTEDIQMSNRQRKMRRAHL